jgi:N-acetylneuraminate lyase
MYIYNIPGATGVNVTPAMVREIVEAAPTVVGVKFTSYNFFEMRQLIDLDLKGKKLNVVSGPDEMMVAGQAMGADGAIGSTYNVLCKWFVDMYQAFRAGDVQKAAEMQAGANRVIATFLSFPSFAALKEMMRLLGFDFGAPRLPLPPMSDADKDLLKQKLTESGFFKMAAMR